MTAQEYQKRRQYALQEIGCGYVVAGFDAMQQTNDSAAPFVQEAYFSYLTGIDEPGWRLIVSEKEGSVLVAPETTEVGRIFDGGLTYEEAQEMSGVQVVVTAQQGDDTLKTLLAGQQACGVLVPPSHETATSFVCNPAPNRLFEQITAGVSDVVDIRPVLARMRGRKDANELDAIRTAVDSTCEAFENVKKSLKRATFEYELEAEFTYAFRKKGLSHAYAPIVASGAHACTLHYQKNDARLPKNGLVLMDVGARFDNYAADVTRTYALGEPSEREIAVHAAVEKAHHEIIALIAPGVSVKEYHDKVDSIMKKALKSLGLLKKPHDYRTYFPHAISHGLGIDVHDPLGAPEVFEPGMVLTVEPGIYIPEEGIGVRIEDDILVTQNGHENLSGSLSTSL